MLNQYEKLKDILREMFQMDQADLDFGIYRVMNAKRDEIETFLNKDLLPQVSSEFAKYRGTEIEEKKKELIQLEATLRDSGMNPDQAPKVKTLREEIAKYGDDEALANEVFSHLSSFFRRYYDNGDFLSLRRYKKDTYAIPYEGEEVKLHWANADQYYIKTSEYLKDYVFKLSDGKLAHFKLVDASQEKDNIKTETGKERKFKLHEEEPIRVDGKNLFIQFIYLPEKEKQDSLNKKTIERLTAEFGKKLKYFAEVFMPAPTAKNPKRTLLERHLYSYTARFNFDFFIHKDLRGFLHRELDFYIKNEVLFIDDLDAQDEKKLKSVVAKVKVIKHIAQKIIIFLAQLEDFQKKLWLKKKFIVSCGYCITLNRIPQALYSEIAKNHAQREEWIKLFAIDEIQGDLTKPGYSKPLTTEFLISNPYLVLDTKHFDKTFIEKLLASFENLDESTDGVIVNSENFQALNLLQEKYRGKIKCIYIDPPFNTGNDFLYKDNYQFSSWMSLLRDRIIGSLPLIMPDGNFFLHLDDNANFYGKILLKNIPYPEITEIIFNTNATKDEESDLYGYKSFGDCFVLKHQTIFHARNENAFFNKLWKPNRNVTTLPIGWLDLIGKKKIASPNGIDDFDYYIEIWSGGKLINQKIDKKDEKIYPVGDIWSDIYSFTQSELRVSESLSFTSSQKPENLLRRIIQCSTKQNEIVMDYFAGIATTAVVAHKLNRKWIAVEMGGHFHEVYSDDGIEKLGAMGRLKNVLHGDRSFKAIDKDRRPHLSKDINWNGGGMFKYILLESYDDTLDNLVVLRNDGQQKTLEKMSAQAREDYMLSYLLNIETRAGDSLLNIDCFNDPLNYTLKIRKDNELKYQKIDLVETFNYLIGLYVEQIETIRGFKVVRGKLRTGEKTLVIWRNTKEKSNEDLDAFFKKQKYNTLDFEFDLIFVNGDNNLENLKVAEDKWKVRLIEEEFKNRMFEQVEV